MCLRDRCLEVGGRFRHSHLPIGWMRKVANSNRLGTAARPAALWVFALMGVLMATHWVALYRSQNTIALSGTTAATGGGIGPVVDDQLPKYDVKKHCEDKVSTLMAFVDPMPGMFSGKMRAWGDERHGYVQQCVSSEQRTYDSLKKVWGQNA